jgi:hypothetical protein
MSEPIFEPNEEPLDENRVVEGLDDPDLPDDDVLPLPEEEPPAPDGYDEPGGGNIPV